MFTFDNLQFVKHAVYNKTKQFRLDFEDGSFFSIVGGDTNRVYGDGINTFEIFSSELNDVLSFVERTRTEQLLSEFQNKHGKVSKVNFVKI